MFSPPKRMCLSSELESRNWDALVTCEYEAVAGDLAWSLLIHAAEDGKLRGLLVSWERLSSRMRSGWPPAGWYSPAMYQEDLELRDVLTAHVAHLATRKEPKIDDCLSILEAQYRDLTVDDRGGALANALGHEEAYLANRPWYWQRRPNLLPWTPE